jgi:hypothetical protein
VFPDFAARQLQVILLLLLLPARKRSDNLHVANFFERT